MASTSANPVLVIGATGRHGNTGGHLVRRLIEEGRAVRVLARTRGERTDALEGAGAEIIEGDLHERRSLVAALADVDLAYFTYPIGAGIVSAAANYAAAVREVGRNPRTVVMSMGPAHPAHPSRLGRDQWLAEHVLQWAGLDLLILRITALFHQILLVLHSRSIRDEGVIRSSFGTDPIGWINGIDAAEIGLAAMLHPDRFDGTVTYPLGPEGFSYAEVAALLSELLGETITFEQVGAEQWRRELIELSALDDGEVVNTAMAQHISSVGAVHAGQGSTRRGGIDPGGLAALTRRGAVPLREFLIANLDAFRPVRIDSIDTERSAYEL